MDLSPEEAAPPLLSNPSGSEPSGPRRPQRPLPPDFLRPGPPVRRRGGPPWTVLLALLSGLMCFAVLVLLSQGMLLPLAAVGGAVFAQIGFHYLLWGWWLSGAIRREVELDEEEERRRDSE